MKWYMYTIQNKEQAQSFNCQVNFHKKRGYSSSVVFPFRWFESIMLKQQKLNYKIVLI